MKQATLFTDGGARGNPGPAGIGIVLTVDNGKPITQGEYIGEATNNVAEYRALIKGLKVAQKENVTNLHCYLDSELVVFQMKGKYRVKDEKLKILFAEAKKLTVLFQEIAFTPVRREKNKLADKLVNEAIDKAVK